jgi:hypothetical protein
MYDFLVIKSTFNYSRINYFMFVCICEVFMRRIIKKTCFFLLSLEYISNAYDTMMYIIIDPTIHYKEACGIQIGQYFLDAE